MSITKIYFMNLFEIMLVTVILMIFITLALYYKGYLNTKREAKENISKITTNNQSFMFGDITKEERDQYDTLATLLRSAHSRRYEVDDPEFLIKDRTIKALLDVSTFDIFTKSSAYDNHDLIFGSQYLLPVHQNDLLRYVLRELNTTHLDAFVKASMVRNVDSIIHLIEKSITSFLNEYYEGEK